MKICRACGHEKPDEGFYPWSGRTCRTCVARKAREWGAKRPERKREIARLSRRRRYERDPELQRLQWRMYRWRKNKAKGTLCRSE